MKASKSIKPVIFIDFGGVYFSMALIPTARRFSKKFHISEKNIHEALMGENWDTHAIGKSSEEKYWKVFSNKLNISDKQMHEFRKSWYSYPKIQPGMKILIKKLKEKYRVAALSSIIIGWVEVMERKYNISDHFHEHHYTYDHGVDKPSEKFFLSAAKKMKVKPKDCIVVDDMKPFIAAVKKTGARTILFKNSKQLETQLRKMDVKV